MDDGQWRAPGRDDGAPRAEPYAPAGAPVPEGEPYGGAPAPSPYVTPSSSAFGTSERHRERVLGGAGYDSPAYRNDRVAVTAMVFGVLGVVVPGLCLVAIAFGHLGLHRLRTSYEGGRGLAVAGLALGYAMTAVWTGLFLLFLSARTLI